MIETISKLNNAIKELDEAMYLVPWTEKHKVIDLSERAKLIRDSLSTLGDSEAEAAGVEFLQIHEQVMTTIKEMSK